MFGELQIGLAFLLGLFELLVLVLCNVCDPETLAEVAKNGSVGVIDRPLVSRDFAVECCKLVRDLVCR